MARVATFIFAILLAATVQGQAPLTATGTYAVGTCKPSFPSYPTISAALAATPSPIVIDVCPGIYPEQLTISYPVTLQGVASGGSGEATITVPGSSLPNQAPSADFITVFPQVLVNSSSGVVTINDITIDGAADSNDNFVVGVFFSNSSGTLNHVTIRNENGCCSSGIGVLAEGGSSNPSVTIENSSIHDFGTYGIWVDTTGASAPSLTATIKSNTVNGGDNGINLGFQATATVTNNIVLNAVVDGIFEMRLASGSISNNTLVNNAIGIRTDGGAASITANKISSSKYWGIDVFLPGGPITGNIITGSPEGINFECVTSPGVHGNIFNDVGNALDLVPGSYSGSNLYYNVPVIRYSPC